MKPFAITYSDYGYGRDGRKIGACWDEAEPDQTINDVIEAIRSGDREHVQRVLLVYPDRAPVDVTAEVFAAVKDYRHAAE